jgi:hypothetical protein
MKNPNQWPIPDIKPGHRTVTDAYSPGQLIPPQVCPGVHVCLTLLFVLLVKCMGFIIVCYIVASFKIFACWLCFYYTYPCLPDLQICLTVGVVSQREVLSSPRHLIPTLMCLMVCFSYLLWFVLCFGTRIDKIHFFMTFKNSLMNKWIMTGFMISKYYDEKKTQNE